MKTASDAQVAGVAPPAGIRVVELRRGEVSAVGSAGDEHETIRQQTGRVRGPRREAAGRAPGSSRRIVELGRRKVVIADAPSSHEHFTIL